MSDPLSATLTPVALADLLAVFAQVVLIDLVLAGDNAVAVGMAASGLDPQRRKRAVLIGLGAAVALRIGLAFTALKLLNVIGLTFAGGLLLLLVSYKMWRDLRSQGRTGAQAVKPAKTLASAVVQILLADISMSLDNVLAVAGAAHSHPIVLFFGLGLSILLMGLAANAISNLLSRWRWIGYVGLAIVIYVAAHMMWEGHRGVVVDLHQVGAYNAIMPDWLDIKPGEARRP